ncbi:MAG: hypothetical protein IPK16_09650 [Anaerolineales bacterium]|nr:hypothetical protein [Anaerolineales bacterium]
MDRTLQLWLADAGGQAALAANGWDGALHPEPEADFVAVVDANLGYNKVDAALQRSLDYSVTWPGGPAAPALAALTVTYTHTATTEDPVCDPRPRYGDTYADLVGRCAFLYTRVYVPGGSQLLGIDGVDQTTAGSQLGEAGATEFAAFQILPPGETRSIVYRYQLPAGITPESYRQRCSARPGSHRCR